ncbi:MAG: hypothetical protein EOP48_13000 [Sphingobacteriales bacterium]|nr:MAG: hypothetical protein EOP48_13000 [Sphingobacteriales bacterium]
MRHPTTIIISMFFLFGLVSCQTSPTDYATKWTGDIKEKIIADANQQFDRTTFDSTYYYLTLYKGDTRLKHFMLRPKFDTTNGKILSVDTLVSIFYSTDQKFELVRELCPAIERSFEGVNYKGIGSVGLTEFRFCDGKIKERGFRYGYKAVGVWTIYDSTGKVVDTKDNGNIEVLEKLHDIKYYR